MAPKAQAKKLVVARRRSPRPAAARRALKAQAEALLDVSSVRLEDDDPIPVYETCDTIRRKIRDILKKDGVTQAGYCRALAQATKTSTSRPRRCSSPGS